MSDSAKELADEERQHTTTIQERDHAVFMADALVAAMERLHGVEFGEHSSANCPWQNALNYLEQ